jgi:CheY-like chemotaxis protein
MTTILVTDDNLVDQKLAGGLLKNIPQVKLEFASNGKQAVKLLQQLPIDLVVTDMQMPEMDGRELVRWIHVNQPEVPVILMTSQGSEQIAVDALNDGAASYVPKSLLARNLVDTVEQILALKQEQHGYIKLLASQKRMEFSYELDNDLPSLHALVDMVQEILAGVDFCDETGCIQTGIALREALINAAFRGNLELSFQDTSKGGNIINERLADEKLGERRIFVDGQVLPEQIRFTIRDEGPGFDVTKALSLAQDARSKIASGDVGRGLVLMQLFMDELLFNDQGNEVTLIKKKVFEIE